MTMNIEKPGGAAKEYLRWKIMQCTIKEKCRSY